MILQLRKPHVFLRAHIFVKSGFMHRLIFPGDFSLIVFDLNLPFRYGLATMVEFGNGGRVVNTASLVFGSNFEKVSRK